MKQKETQAAKNCLPYPKSGKQAFKTASLLAIKKRVLRRTYGNVLLRD